ncbi:MAG: TMEM165/GDT1 family protein [Ilumatobacteraceae bacterium]
MIGAALAAFAVVFVAELPDKTMIASLVLATRYRRPFAVWIGVAGAFAIHVCAAVILGSLLSRLPARPVAIAVGLLFLIGAIVLWRSEDDADQHDPVRLASSFSEVALASGAVVLLAELGDLTQLATAGLASRSGQPVATAIGALLALVCVAALAVTAGSWIVRTVPLRAVRRTAAVVFAGFAIWSFVTAVRA